MKKNSNVPLARRIKKNSVYYVMIAPFFLIFFLFIFIPVISAVVLSFTSFDMVQLPEFTGFDNYIRLLFDDEIFLKALQNTLIFAVVTGPVGFLLSFVVAWLINELNPALRKFITLVMYKAPLEMTDTAVSVDMCEKAVRMFKAINKPIQSDFASALKEQLKGAARERLLDLNTMTALGNCQTSQAMAIAYNIFEPGEESTAFSRLLQIIQRDGGVMDVGVHGARVLFHVLAAFGHADLAYKMITQSKFPSFGWLVDIGATTLWENFMKPETKWFDSRNHQFWGDVSHWFHRWIVGINYSAPEKRLEIAPQFIEGLEFAEGSFKANEGEIRVLWKKEDENIRLEVSAPDDLNGFIRLPMNYTFKDEELGIGTSVKKLESGNYAVIKYK